MGNEPMAALEAVHARQLSERLENSDEWLRTLLDATSEGLLVADPKDGQLLFANQAICRMTGYAPDEFIALSITDIHPVHALPVVLSEFRRHADQEGTVSVEIPVLRKNGSEFLADIRSSRFEIEGKKYLLGLFNDVTDRARRQVAERRHLVLMKAVQRIAKLGYWVWDGESRTFDWSEEVQTILGNDAEGQPNYRALMQQIPLPDRNRLKAAVRAVVSGMVREFDLEHEILTFDGELRTVHTRGEAVVDSQGDFKGLIGTMLDMSSSRQMQSRLETSEQRFREFSEIAADWLWEMGPDLRFTYVSENVRSVLTGVESSQMVGKRREEYHRPYTDTDTDDWREHLELLRDRKPFRDFRVNWQTEDGLTRFFSLSGKPRFDNENNFLGYRGAGRDITDLIETRRREKDLQALLNDAFENISDGLLLFDDEDRLIYFNSAYKRNAGAVADMIQPGVTLEQLAVEFVRSGEIVVPQGQEAAWLEQRMKMHRRRERGTLLIQLRNDRWVEMTEYPTAGGGTLVLRYDVTEAKRAERALLESEARFRHIFNSSPLGIAVASLDEQARVIAANPMMCKLLGYSHEEMLGTTLWDITHPEDAVLSRQFSDRVLAGDQKGYTLEKRYLHKDGRTIWGRLSSSVVCDTEGRELAMLSLIEDISEKKAAEEEIGHLLDENQRLARFAIDASEKERKLVARELHDELGQLLTAIRLDADVIFSLMDDAPQQVTEGLQDILWQADRAQTRIRTMTHRLHPLELEHLGLVDTLRNEIDLWQRRNQNIRCDFHVTGTFDDLADDLALNLYRIVQESLTNIIRYAEASSVQIRMDHVVQGEEHVELTIRDNGVGMDLDTVKLGLGLLGMRERVELYRGTFELVSKPGGGMSISVWIPVYKD